MTTVLHASPYSKLIEIKHNLLQQNLFKLYKSQCSHFLTGSSSIRDNISAPIQFRRENNPASSKIIFHLGQTHLFLHYSKETIKNETI